MAMKKSEFHIPRSEQRRTAIRYRVLGALETTDNRLSPADIARITGIKCDQVRTALYKLQDEKCVIKHGHNNTATWERLTIPRYYQLLIEVAETLFIPHYRDVEGDAVVAGLLKEDLDRWRRTANGERVNPEELKNYPRDGNGTG